MQLVAYGAQDVYLTGNPKVTFFQAVYRRHTNFAMENIEQTVNGTPANSGRVSVTIARNGDLVGDMYVELKTHATTVATATGGSGADACWIAERAIKDVELSVGEDGLREVQADACLESLTLGFDDGQHPGVAHGELAPA